MLSYFTRATIEQFRRNAWLSCYQSSTQPAVSYTEVETQP